MSRLAITKSEGTENRDAQDAGNGIARYFILNFFLYMIQVSLYFKRLSMRILWASQLSRALHQRMGPKKTSPLSTTSFSMPVYVYRYRPQSRVSFANTECFPELRSTKRSRICLFFAIRILASSSMYHRVDQASRHAIGLHLWPINRAP